LAERAVIEDMKGILLAPSRSNLLRRITGRSRTLSNRNAGTAILDAASDSVAASQRVTGQSSSFRGNLATKSRPSGANHGGLRTGSAQRGPGRQDESQIAFRLFFVDEPLRGRQKFRNYQMLGAG